MLPSGFGGFGVYKSKTQLCFKQPNSGIGTRDTNTNPRIPIPCC